MCEEHALHRAGRAQGSVHGQGGCECVREGQAQCNMGQGTEGMVSVLDGMAVLTVAEGVREGGKGGKKKESRVQ